MARLLFIAPIVAIIAIPVYFLLLKGPPPLPDLDYNEWWGPDSLKAKQDTSIKPFKISFAEDTIKDLRDRLKRSRSFTPPLEGVAFEYGFNSAQLDGWLKYWANEYKFKERENFLNQFPQFKTNIQGLDIHFIRVTPKVPAGVEIVPLLLLHGWPGSVREFYEAIPLITAVNKDRDFAVEVIVPSLPGFGFSDGAVRPGLAPPQIGVVMRNLMHRLGYKKFYLEGGDWGSVIGASMVTFFPEEILGYHNTMTFMMSPLLAFLETIGSIYPPLVVDAKAADRMYPLGKKYSFFIEESGYFHLQATKPDTVGVALSDSPAGLLAYILEKFSTLTRPEHRNQLDGGLSYRFTKDQLIDNLMMYWATGSITTSIRLYSEYSTSKIFGWKLDDIPTSVPVWALQAKNELTYLPPWLLKFKFTNLVGVTFLEDGGHFLAFELPKIFSEDVLKALGEFRKLSKKNEKTDL